MLFHPPHFWGKLGRLAEREEFHSPFKLKNRVLLRGFMLTYYLILFFNIVTAQFAGGQGA